MNRLPLRSGVLSLALTVFAILATDVEAKGTTGFGRSMGGGYYRSSKTGYYSRTNRYYVYGMYWRSGYYYSYRGPSFRQRATQLSQQQMQNLLCRREVRVDTNVPATDGVNFVDIVAVNSTQKCYIENDSTPNSPLNVPVDTLMLSRFRFVLSARPYPTVDLVVYPDKDISVGLVNNTIRLTKLFFSTHATVVAEAFAIDLGALQWRPCTLDSCVPSTTLQTGNAFGQPSSRFMEGSRVFFTSVFSEWNNALRIQLRFWLSDDFDEDAAFDHVFLMPNAVKVDIVTTMLPQYSRYFGGSNASIGGSDLHYGVEALLAAPVTGAGAAVRYLPTPVGRQATEYNPQRQARVQLGTVTDQTNYQASFVSWASATSGIHLCWDNSSTTSPNTCVGFVQEDPRDLNNSIACAVGANVGVCQNLLRPDQQAYRLQWIERGAASDPRTRSWYLSFGYLDPAVATQPDSSAGYVAPSSCVAMLALLLIVL